MNLDISDMLGAATSPREDVSTLVVDHFSVISLPGQGIVLSSSFLHYPTTVNTTYKTSLHLTCVYWIDKQKSGILTPRVPLRFCATGTF